MFNIKGGLGGLEGLVTQNGDNTTSWYDENRLFKSTVLAFCLDESGCSTHCIVE